MKMADICVLKKIKTNPDNAAENSLKYKTSVI